MQDDTLGLFIYCANWGVLVCTVMIAYGVQRGENAEYSAECGGTYPIEDTNSSFSFCTLLPGISPLFGGERDVLRERWSCRWSTGLFMGASGLIRVLVLCTIRVSDDVGHSEPIDGTCTLCQPACHARYHEDIICSRSSRYLGNSGLVIGDRQREK